MRRLLSYLRILHGKLVLGRRVKALADAIAALIPAGSSVLDIGCGDGQIGYLVAQRRPGITVEGMDVHARDRHMIPCRLFNGRSIPLDDASFDLCLLSDVLHHADDARALLKEACRVSRRYVLIKDHISENRFDALILGMMDWTGNRPYGVALPYRFLSRSQWNDLFAELDLVPVSWQSDLKLYPFPFNLVFGRDLHFLVLAQKRTAREPA